MKAAELTPAWFQQRVELVVLPLDCVLVDEPLHLHERFRGPAGASRVDTL